MPAATAPVCRHVEPAAPARAVDDTITLDETARHRRRTRMRSDAGVEFLLDLPEARLLRDGEVLALSDGRRIVVRAAPEALRAVRGRDARHLLTLAWHLGNRHLPTQVMDDHLRIRDDPVIVRMLERLGGRATALSAPFDPESGAYDGPAAAAGHGHDHNHGHDPS